MTRSKAKDVEVPAAIAAARLRLTREQTVRRVQRGVLRGRYDAWRGWLVDSAAIDEYLRDAQQRGVDGVARGGRGRTKREASAKPPQPNRAA
jgi:hypothetical protein